ncbi:hypothetical protein CPC08DRAFT_718827 [Agrocybe pediades]|nr:hypothetical protein CPC08DRAFT_718827 [Agrocybe pediades]
MDSNHDIWHRYYEKLFDLNRSIFNFQRSILVLQTLHEYLWDVGSLFVRHAISLVEVIITDHGHDFRHLSCYKLFVHLKMQNTDKVSRVKPGEASRCVVSVTEWQLPSGSLLRFPIPLSLLEYSLVYLANYWSLQDLPDDASIIIPESGLLEDQSATYPINSNAPPEG